MIIQKMLEKLRLAFFLEGIKQFGSVIKFSDFLGKPNFGKMLLIIIKCLVWVI